MTSKKDPACSDCSLQEKICLSETGKESKTCPTLTMGETIESAMKRYEVPGTARFAQEASQQEAECYFARHERPFTVIAFKTICATKDRVLGHNPIAALYLSNSYYGRLSEKK